MRVPPSVKLVVATWIAALLGALAGRSAAEAFGAPLEQQHTNASVATRSEAR
jgi:hypothetical protein